MNVWMIRYILRAVTLLLLPAWLSYASVEAVAENLQFQSDTIILTVYRQEHDVEKGCRIVEKRSRPHVTSMAEDSTTPIPVSEEFVTFMIGLCDETNHIRYKHIRRKRQFIYPGTKWCGMGNIASGNNDLGTLVATDTCCRAHDQCNVTIGPKEMNGGLQNDNMFSKVSCLCEEEFRECLKRAEQQGEKDAGKIGDLYFNRLNQKCIVMETPPRICQKWLHDICLHLVPDPKKESIFRLVERRLKY
ncbi:hypothetical protein CHS0354_034364 [Potamilus streckersoni]|uniref:Phospholipase A2-like central domain-containing protein n=1 Tax=Potamilus streckersoni TaxID=2493646 RepID=A0AAE0WDW3_9BIVA|nr:hypothetical protein CHS0354_034364 [Potamilus streckersoni]